MSGNMQHCPYCKAETLGKTGEERMEELKKRVDVNNDAGSMLVLASHYYRGGAGLLQDQTKAMELWKQAAERGSSQALCELGNIYHEGGYLKKSKFHWEAASMAGHEVARSNLGIIEADYGNRERAVKHWIIAASAGSHLAMQALRESFI